MSEKESYILKVLVLGDPATGKTSIIKRYVHNLFTPTHKPTVGVDFHLKVIQVGENTVRLQLWDIAGQDRFGAIARVYYKDAYGAMLVYDLERPETFDHVVKWKEEIDSKVLLPNGMPLPVVLLGNKSDKVAQSDIDRNMLDAFVIEKKFIGFFDTSAKNPVNNIDKAAKLLVDKILEHQDIFSKQQSTATEGAFKPTAAGALSNQKSGGCC